jgi:hypothetical protein
MPRSPVVLMLTEPAKRRGIPHPWVFMLLGQIVAISFAANLSFVAFTVYDVAIPRSQGTKKKSRRELAGISSSSLTTFWWPLILGINIACAICIPNSFGSPQFMPLLLIPHVLAFAPMLLTTFQSSSDLPQMPFMSMQIGSIVIFLGIATVQAVTAGGDLCLVIDTLYEHPAVSSVGWDVICCWVSFIAWSVLSSKRSGVA